jgi:hypothetical protein
MRLTSLPNAAQNRLLTYLDRPLSSTTKRPKLSFSDSGLTSAFTSVSLPLSGLTCAPFGFVPSTSGRGSGSSSSTCTPKLCTTPSSRRRRASSSPSGGFRGLLGALPGAGKIQSICAFWQLAHGYRLSQRTFLRRQVTHDRGFSAGPAPPPVADEGVEVEAGFVCGGPDVLILAGLPCASVCSAMSEVDEAEVGDEMSEER